MDDTNITKNSMLEKLILDIEKTVLNAKENLSQAERNGIKSLIEQLKLKL